MNKENASKLWKIIQEAGDYLHHQFWVHTIKEGRFEDTNQMFIKPHNFNFHVTTQNAKQWAKQIAEKIK